MVQLFILCGQDLRQLDASSFGLANGRQKDVGAEKGRGLPGLASQSIQQSTDCPSLVFCKLLGQVASYFIVYIYIMEYLVSLGVDR